MIYKADLHIHSVLSPCGSLEMSPSLIIKTAKEKGLDIIGIADHNSTLNAKITADLGEKHNIMVVMGAEITTKEEVHCLCFMPNYAKLQDFQSFINSKYRNNTYPNRTKFEQFIVDENENILGEVENYLIDAIDVDIKTLQVHVKMLGGIFIPAHVDRAYYSLSSQLVFVPNDLDFSVMEITPHAKRNDFFVNFPWFENYKYIQNSDAHFLNDIAKTYTNYEMENLSFNCLKNAIDNHQFKVK